MVLAVVLTMTLAAGSGVYAAHVTLALIPTDNIHDDTNLNSPNGIATFESGGHTYAAVAADDGDNVQILNITDPSDITLAGNIRDDISSRTLVLNGAKDIAIFESGSHTYAAVTGADDDGVQILNITDPSDITAAGNITKGSSVKLDSPRGIAIFESGRHTYAAVAAYASKAVQILNITDPSNVTAAGSIANNPNVNLDGIFNIATFESGGHTYAAVAAFTGNAVQILNITDPSNVTAAGNITNGSNLHLGGPDALATFKSDGSTYAAVTSDTDSAVQILNITDPTAITAAGSITDTTNLDNLEDIVIFKSEGHTYAAVAARDAGAVQILDLTNLAGITIVGGITHAGGDILLDSARGIAKFESGGRTHIAVTSFLNTVQIIKVEITIPDTTPPVLTLTGDASVITPMDAPYTDAGATCVDVVDGIEVSLTPTLTSTAVDTGTAGEYTVTYSCFDNAGNPAVEVSRIVTVQPPVSLTPTASITNGTDAKLAGAHAITIFDSGNYAAVVAKDSNAVQILDITNPANIRPAGSITDDADLALAGAQDIAIYDSGRYAAVAAFDEGVQILDISNRDNITAVNNTSHNPDLDLYGTHAIATFTSDSDTYAAVTSYDFDLLDITDPTDIPAVDKDHDFRNLGFGEFDDIAIFESGGVRYAAVTASYGSAVYLLDITNSSNITVADSISESDDEAGLVLGGAQALDIFESGGDRYAAVVAPIDAGNERISGIQILNITDPTDITAAGNITDSTDLALDGAQDIVTFKSGSDWYAAVAAKKDSGVQILDITDPFSIAPVGRITDDNSLNLEGAQAIDTFTSGGDRYVAVAAAGDDAVQILRIDITAPDDTPPGSTPPSNAAPVLESIAPQSTSEGVELSFTATATDTDTDNDQLTFLLIDPIPAGAEITPNGLFTWTPGVDQAGSHTIVVSVTDGTDTDTQRVSITVRDVTGSLVAVATGPTEADEGSAVTLDGSTSYDPNDSTASLTYSWTSPPGIMLNNYTAAAPTFTAPTVFEDTSYAFTLTVTNGGDSGIATVTVLVRNSINEPPVASAAGPQSAGEEVLVTLDGSTSYDPNDDPLDYLWEYLGTTPSLNLAGADTPSPTFTTPHVKGNVTLQFRLTVTDSHNVSDTDDVTVILQDTLSNLPVSDPGQGQTVGERAPVRLSGTASYDPNDDRLTYLWNQTAGPAVQDLSGNTTETVTFTAPSVQADTTLVFSLTVTDTDGGSDTDTVSIRVENSLTGTPFARPQAFGPDDGPVSEGEVVTLDGTLSYDPNGDIREYAWTQVSRANVTLSTPSEVNATFQAPRVPDPITLVFELVVTDNEGDTGTKRLSVVIPDDRNDPPILEDIPAQSKDELEIISFQASATDEDGNDLRFSLEGDVPRGASMTRDGLFSWTPNQSQDGVYSLNVTVSDGDGGTASQLVGVTVNDIAPMYVSARASSSTITLTLSEAVVSSDIGPNGFTVSTSGAPLEVESITGNGTTKLTLGLNGTVPRGTTLSYDSSTGNVQDETGKPLPDFTDEHISFPSKSRSVTTPPAITVGSQGHPQTTVSDWLEDFGNQKVIRESPNYGQYADLEPGAVISGPIQPLPAGGATFPLVIDGNGYVLHSNPATLVPANVTAGQPVTVQVTIHDPTPVSYFAIYLNLQGDSISHLQSDAQVVWDSGNVRVTDPSGLMQSVTMTVLADPSDPAVKVATLTATFSEGMGESNMVVRTWNAGGQITQVRVFDAIAVTPPVQETVDPEPTDLPVLIDPEPTGDSDSATSSLLAIRMWSGFEPESMTDSQLLASLGLDYPGADIPSWVMTELGVLVANGDVTVDGFVTALTYVLENS